MNANQVKAEQTAYRNTPPSFLGRGIERLTNPVGKALAGMLPKSMVESVLKGLDKAMTMPELVTFDHDTSDIASAQRAAENVERYARTINASSGAAAGLGGALTASADIPATIAIALRAIRDTGRAYGFDGEGERERLFRLQVLEIAALDSHEEKIDRLDALEADIDETGALAPIDTSSIAPVIDQVVERVSRAIAFASVRRRAGMVIPLVGSAVGGFVNAQFQRDVARAARYAFQARRLRTME
ncbi:MAG: EcsC family protein [Erythrobacter sp.]